MLLHRQWRVSIVKNKEYITISYFVFKFQTQFRRIITSGSDGDIRIWNGIDDDDPSSQCVGEFVLAICHYNERMLASTDLNTVQAYTFPAGDRDGIEFRFTAPATCIKVDKKVIKLIDYFTGKILC